MDRGSLKSGLDWVEFRDMTTFNSLDAKAITHNNLNYTIYSMPNMICVPKPHNDEEELRV